MSRLQEFMDQTSEWSDEKFDKGRRTQKRALSISYHLKKEVKELNEALEIYFQEHSSKNYLNASEEIADCMILILDCANHFGFHAEYLLDLCYNKLEINKARIWGEPDENGVVEHIH